MTNDDLSFLSPTERKAALAQRRRDAQRRAAIDGKEEEWRARREESDRMAKPWAEFVMAHCPGLADAARTPLELAEFNASALPGFLRVLRPGGRLLAKVSDYVSSGKLFPGRHHLMVAALAAGFELLDEFVHASGTGPQPSLNLDGTPRRQIHSRRAHSYLLVLGRRNLPGGYPMINRRKESQ
jgi:hypothetical protein